MKERGNSRTRKSGCYVCKHSKLETLHGRLETRCLLDNMLVMRPSKGCSELKIMTNGDRIRKMEDEELAELLLWNVCTVCDGRGFEKCGDDKHCKKHVAKWLKQEVSEDVRTD